MRIAGGGTCADSDGAEGDEMGGYRHMRGRARRLWEVKAERE